MEEEIELHYSPSRWTVATSPEEAINQHITDVTRASEAAKEKVPHLADLQYGPRDKQYCDLYGTDLPEDSPMFVYIHGGYWQMLSKDVSAYPVIPLWQAGIRTVIVGYDLTPQVSLDTIVEEIRELAIYVLEMAKENESRGVWFGGHSAGAHLASFLLQSDWFYSLEPQLSCRMKGLVLISGIYDLTPLIYTSNNDALQLDRKSALKLSPFFNLVLTQQETNVKVLLVVGEYDSPTFHGQTKSFSQLLKRKKIGHEVVEIPNLDHFTVVTSLQDDTSFLAQKLVSLIVPNKEIINI
ncbi:kynurenine formamidase [Macrosteles quadrilineatus]|uniref:kynurenine formamidase n=1 Tax=Macrosteles quadrilineatus TaxID=74068 RepID=UPI0023E1A0B7|nr:kynurenine formamidase [Macrosteles quadrilineatus]